MFDTQRRRQAREYDARRADAAEAMIRKIDAAGTKAAGKIMAAMREALAITGIIEGDLAGRVDEFVVDYLFYARAVNQAEMEAAGFDWPDRPDYTTGATTPPTSPLPKGAA